MALSHKNTYKITIKQQQKTSPWALCVLSPQALQRDPWALRTKYKRMSDSHIAPRWDGYRRRVIPMERSMTRVGTLWLTYKKLWKITIFNGKTHYKCPFSTNIAMENHHF